MFTLCSSSTIAMSECAAYEEVGLGGHESYNAKMAMQQCDAYGQVEQNGQRGTHKVVV